MILRPPRATRTDTLFPDPALVRSWPRARRRRARGALPARRRRRFRRCRAGGGRPAALVRPRDLAASARARDARRAIVACDQHPCQPPLSPRRIAAMRGWMIATIGIAGAALAAPPAVAPAATPQAQRDRKSVV